jgi:hypothetical protein
MRAIALALAIFAPLLAAPELARADGETQLYVRFAQENRIAANIRNDCQLVEKLGDFIVRGSGGRVVAASGEPNTASGSVLVVEITDSISQGNAFVGHRKYTEIQGTLYREGKPASDFVASRNSGGGFGGGYKGSCAVLGRTVKALGADVNRWLESPKSGARLGDS